jgi:hypothetical protein
MTPLKRREFGQLAAASLTSTVIAGLSSKALAQRSGLRKEIIYGVNPQSASKDENREDQTPPVELSVADLATGKIISKANLPVLFVDNPSPVSKKSRAFFLPDSNRATKMVVLGDGSVVTSTVSSTRNGYFNHIIFTVGLSSIVGNARNLQSRAKKVLDLKRFNQTIESLLSLANNQFLCLVGTEGIPPFTMITLDSITGKISSRNELDLPPLPPNHRFANLCQDQKGTIFATETGSEGVPILISMNLQEKAMITGKVKINRLTPLSFEGRPLINDVKDLNFSPSGELYALAAPNGGKDNALFRVDVKTGKMGLVSKFAAEKFAFSV